ncbi:MAG: hypothetical protein ABIS50_08110 [Luteolibacter sp.]|uniref:hypothetical protein n=1 Tax=Luteolibacter sp. TaxID=1962973 RepID=UPI0032673F4B
MKPVTPLLGAAGLLYLSQPISAAVLTLLDWTTVPVPSGTDHSDTYTLPWDINSLLAGGRTITSLELDYNNLPLVSGLGIHQILGAAFLFKSSDLASTTVIESTAERYWARIVFKTVPTNRQLNGLTNQNAPAFVAMHTNAFGSATTSAYWTATFSDGSTSSSNNGIIPEPCGLALISVSAVFAIFRRTNRRGSHF